MVKNMYEVKNIINGKLWGEFCFYKKKLISTKTKCTCTLKLAYVCDTKLFERK